MSWHRTGGMMLKAPAERSLWPAGRIEVAECGPVRLAPEPRVLRLTGLTIAGHHVGEVDPHSIDAIVVGGVRFDRRRS